MPKLTDPWFEAEFYGNTKKGGGYQRQGSNIEGAQGLFLWCPCAYPDDKRAHGLVVPFANPRNAPPVHPDHGPNRPGSKGKPRWHMEGTSLDDLTISPSVAVGSPECWHGFITKGEVI